ncbi:MAG: hypothetical protein WBI17_02310 [Clostridiaceae bacterium]
MDGKSGFLSKFKDISYFDVEYKPVLSQNNCIKINNIDVFTDYIRINDIKSVFVHFGYYDPNEYEVTRDDFVEKYHKHLNIIKMGINRRDIYVQRMYSLDEPNSAVSFLNFEGYTVYFEELDPWLDKFYVLPKTEYIKEILPILDAELERVTKA